MNSRNLTLNFIKPLTFTFIMIKYKSNQSLYNCALELYILRLLLNSQCLSKQLNKNPKKNFF